MAGLIASLASAYAVMPTGELRHPPRMLKAQRECLHMVLRASKRVEADLILMGDEVGRTSEVLVKGIPKLIVSSDSGTIEVMIWRSCLGIGLVASGAVAM